MTAPPGRVRRRIVAVSAALLVAFLMSGFALLVRTSERNAKTALADRWGARATLTASFARSYIDDLASRERAQAVRLLSAPTVDEASFDQRSSRSTSTVRCCSTAMAVRCRCGRRGLI
jgi:hypothetical protein